jgi:hypothetical protein
MNLDQTMALAVGAVGAAATALPMAAAQVALDASSPVALGAAAVVGVAAVGAAGTAAVAYFKAGEAYKRLGDVTELREAIKAVRESLARIEGDQRELAEKVDRFRDELVKHQLDCPAKLKP